MCGLNYFGYVEFALFCVFIILYRLLVKLIYDLFSLFYFKTRVDLRIFNFFCSYICEWMIVLLNFDDRLNYKYVVDTSV